MCGILGWARKNNCINEELFQRMLLTLSHRGPDDSGVFFSKNKELALGHRRLSFLDLSPAGKQPFLFHDGKVVVSFNGEIYNYLELKTELLNDYNFQTNTDTEVIVAAYLKWGISFVNRLKGMFAILIYDEEKQQMYLIRDRFGIKPLYYLHSDNDFIVASELKAIIQSGISKQEIDYTSMIDYFVYRYVPSPKTIWCDIKKLPPAHYLTICLKTFASEQVAYWDLVAENQSDQVEKITAEVEAIVTNSVKEHTRSDVPIGAFLSGGYDSSAITALMKQKGMNPATFSIGFKDWPNSEDKYASIVADYLNVDNEVVIADESDLSLLELMPTIYDEPIADISIIPTYMVSRLARKKVKAVLSGEGADEIFAGYTWQKEYVKLTHPTSIIGKLKQLFQPIDTVSYYAESMSMGKFDKVELRKMLRPELHQFIPNDEHWFYRKHFKKQLTPLKSIQYLDMKCFMGELVLTKVDRASMANSLEVRVPFLDHTLFEKVFEKDEQKYYDKTQTKRVLYELIKSSLPKSILDRKKQGFVGPDAYYMNTDFYRKELENSQLVKFGIINQAYINEQLNERYTWKLWKIVVFEKWFKKWVVSTL